MWLYETPALQLYCKCKFNLSCQRFLFIWKSCLISLLHRLIEFANTQPQDDNAPKLIGLLKWRYHKDSPDGCDKDDSEDASDSNYSSHPSDPDDTDEDNNQYDDKVGDHDTDSKDSNDSTEGTSQAHDDNEPPSVVFGEGDNGENDDDDDVEDSDDEEDDGKRNTLSGKLNVQVFSIHLNAAHDVFVYYSCSGHQQS